MFPPEPPKDMHIAELDNQKGLFDLTEEDDEDMEIEETAGIIGIKSMESRQSSFKQLLMGGVNRFWQSPQKQERQPWWKSMISSPARRLVDAN
jgi:hypothetical protein